MLSSVPFVLVNAFSSDLAGGNPAAVVFLPEAFDTPGPHFSKANLQTIAKNLNQPITSFLAPLPANPLGGEIKADYAIRWFTTEHEAVLCGHGTLAATRAILTSPEMAVHREGSLVSPPRQTGK